MGITKKVIKVGKISGKYDILTVERKKYPVLEIRQKEALIYKKASNVNFRNISLL